MVKTTLFGTRVNFDLRFKIRSVMKNGSSNGRDSHAIVDSCENDDIVKFLDLFLMFKRLTTNVKLGLREKR